MKNYNRQVKSGSFRTITGMAVSGILFLIQGGQNHVGVELSQGGQYQVVLDLSQGGQNQVVVKLSQGVQNQVNIDISHIERQKDNNTIN